MTNFALLIISEVTSIITQPCNLQFRLHTYLARHPWALVWYALRALDQPGRGYYEIPLPLLEAITGRDEKSIYRLLLQGKQNKAFRKYQVRRGILKVWLGGLFKVTAALNLESWGAVAMCNLLELDKLRPLTTYAHTQRLQQKSHYAANSQLKPDMRRLYGSPTANQLIPEKHQPSHKPVKGEILRVLWVSKKKLFVSAGFVSYGTSQKTIGDDLGVNASTVQRHLGRLGVARRQLCQAKGEYSRMKIHLDELDLTMCTDTGKERPDKFGYLFDDSGAKVHFWDGVPVGAKKPRTPNKYITPQDGFKNRFFRLNASCFRNKTWMAKCNIYREELSLKSMAASRSEYRAFIKQEKLNLKSSPPKSGER